MIIVTIKEVIKMNNGIEKENGVADDNNIDEVTEAVDDAETSDDTGAVVNTDSFDNAEAFCSDTVEETNKAEESNMIEETMTDSVADVENEDGVLADAGGAGKKKDTKTKKRKRKIILTVVLSVLAIFVLSGIIAWIVLNAKGRNDLYNKAESSAPIMESIEPEESQAAEAQNDVTWKKGWVRYNGDIYQYNEDILTFLVMGIDKTGKVKAVESGVDGGQADLIMLAVFNPHTKNVSLITINRNTMTEIDVYDDNGDYIGSGQGQICLQHGYGDGAELSCERTEKAVSNLFYNLPIHGYLSINMGAIKAINSAVGGVTITLDDDFQAVMDGVSVFLPKGDNTLTDDEAYVYIRYRDHSEFDSATTRLNRQKKYIAALISKLKEETAKDFTVPINVFNELLPYIVTDITTSEITYMVSNTYGYSFNFNNIYSLEGTTTIGKTEHEEFNYDSEQLYNMIIDIFYEKVE